MADNLGQTMILVIAKMTTIGSQGSHHASLEVGENLRVQRKRKLSDRLGQFIDFCRIQGWQLYSEHTVTS